MVRTDCQYVRITNSKKSTTLHCFLRKENCTEEECDVCDMRHISVSEYAGERKKAWVASKSRGLGDTIAKVTKATGIASFVHYASGIMGVDCGCDKRQELLNKFFPYTYDTED